MLEDLVQHRDAAPDQPEPQGNRGVGHTGGVEPAERVHPCTHRLRRTELSAHLIGQIVHEGIEFAQELDTELRDRRAGVVPESDPLTDRIGTAGAACLDARARRGFVCVSAATRWESSRFTAYPLLILNLGTHLRAGSDGRAVPQFRTKRKRRAPVVSQEVLGSPVVPHSGKGRAQKSRERKKVP